MTNRSTRICVMLMAAALLGGCGWYRTTLPVRDGPQAEPHVTYASSDAVVRRMTAGAHEASTPARSICGAGSAAAAQQAAIASGRFGAPVATNPDRYGSRSILFNDGRGTAVMITTGPDGYQCTWSDGAGTSTWQDGVPAA